MAQIVPLALSGLLDLAIIILFVFFKHLHRICSRWQHGSAFVQGLHAAGCQIAAEFVDAFRIGRT